MLRMMSTAITSKRIVVLSEHHLADPGGIENYVRNLATALSHAGHDVTIVTPRRLTDGKLAVIRKRFFWPLIKPAWLPLFVFLWKKAKRGEIDVLVCGKGLFEGLVGYYLHTYLQLPYIVCTYAMEIEVWAGRAHTRRKLVRVLREARAVLYINETTKQELLRLGAGDDRLIKLLPGVCEDFLRSPTQAEVDRVLDRYGVRSPYVVSVGRLIARKGFDDLILAFSQLDQTKFAEVTLVIVGRGPLRVRLRDLVEREWIGKSILFLEDVPDTDLPALYKGAEFFALTPKRIGRDVEGFGIVYLEAAAQGKPALATQTGGVPGAVVPGATGLLMKEQNIRDIRTGLERLLTDSVLRSRLGRQARERVLTEFRWKHRVTPLLKLLDSINEPR